MPDQELARLQAIERRLKLLLPGSDNWEVPGWETEKVQACVRTIRQLVDREITPEEATWQPCK